MAVDTSHPAAHRRASPGVPSVATAQGRRIGTAASRVARCACLALGVAGAAQAAGLGMAFTYQGELQVSGTPAEGVYDLEFVLFPVDDGGSAVATHRAEDVDVQGGLFTTEIDYTYVPFLIGDQYWIELRVRPGASSGGFQQLLPRQKLTPAPYAIAARYVAGIGGVTQQALAVGAVGTASPLLGDGRSVSPVRIASGGITASHLATNSITADRIRDEAGVADGSGPFAYLVSTPSAVAEVTINAPAAGKVLLIAHMDLVFHRNGATPAQSVYWLLRDTPGATSGNESLRVPAGTPGNDTRVATTTRTFNVTAGSHTFYLNAREGTSTGTVQVKNPIIRAIYFPTGY